MTFLKKILLVDHDAGVTASVRAALQECGHYRLREEHDERYACQAARWFQPDLILCDLPRTQTIRSPRVLELQQQAAATNTPFVILTANAAEDGGFSSSGILSGYTFFANSTRLQDFIRCVGEILYPISGR